MQQVNLTQAVWRKSTHSSANGACVEVAFAGEVVGVRDTKDRSGPVLLFTPREWAAFVGGVTSDEFAL